MSKDEEWNTDYRLVLFPFLFVFNFYSAYLKQYKKFLVSTDWRSWKDNRTKRVSTWWDWETGQTDGAGQRRTVSSLMQWQEISLHTF